MADEIMAETAGVALIGDLLAHLAAGGDANAASFAKQVGAARSTAYQAIEKLERAGFVERDARGSLAPGANAARLGLASLRLAALLSAAEALLPALRNDADATASLVSVAKGTEIVLMRRAASWDAREGAGKELEAAIAETARLRLRLRPRANEAERRAAKFSLEQTAEALRRALADAADLRERRAGGA
ncbi:MAG TPA: helix-turn-helix domain-containing protein [Roseiarcus sp.]|nr:helix-turn-helix domain-containing protein [Roseiarcus sp.]